MPLIKEISNESFNYKFNNNDYLFTYHQDKMTEENKTTKKTKGYWTLTTINEDLQFKPKQAAKKILESLNLDKNFIKNIKPNELITYASHNAIKDQRIKYIDEDTDYTYSTYFPSKLSPKEFYKKLLKLLEERANEEGIRDLNKYFFLTDDLDSWVYKHDLGLNKDTPSNGLNFLFAELVYHRGNSQQNPLINFKKNLETFKTVLKDFNVDLFLETYENKSLEEISRAFSPIMEHPKTLERYQTNVSKFSTLLLNYARFLKSCGSYEAVISNLKAHSDENNPLTLVNYFINEVVGEKLGMGIALSCDYLKEISNEFNYLMKPDLHVKDFLRIYYGLGAKLSDEEALNYGIKLVKEINANEEEKITAYKLDRIIYLLGSDFFFLDKDTRNKKQASHYKWEVILPQINDYLFEEDKTIKNYFKDFPLNEALMKGQKFLEPISYTYYPGAGFDMTPLELFNPVSNLYIYSDYLLPKEDVSKALHLDNYKVNVKELKLSEKVLMEYKKYLNTLTINEIIEPYKLLFKFKKIDKNKPGLETIYLIYYGFESLFIYQKLSKIYQEESFFLAFIKDHGFGGNFTTFGNNGDLKKLASKLNYYPKFMIAQEKENIGGGAWDNYEEVSVKPYNMIYNELLYLYKKKD